MGEIKLTEDVVNKKEGVMVCPECGSTTILFDPARESMFVHPVDWLFPSML